MTVKFYLCLSSARMYTSQALSTASPGSFPPAYFYTLDPFQVINAHDSSTVWALWAPQTNSHASADTIDAAPDWSICCSTLAWNYIMTPLQLFASSTSDLLPKLPWTASCCRQTVWILTGTLFLWMKSGLGSSQETSSAVWLWFVLYSRAFATDWTIKASLDSLTV